MYPDNGHIVQKNLHHMNGKFPPITRYYRQDATDYTILPESVDHWAMTVTSPY
jgi:hypothetical protein